MPVTLPESERERRLATVAECQAAGRPVAHAARLLGLSPNTFREWLRSEQSRVRPALPEVQAPPPAQDATVQLPREVRDSKFYRDKAAALAKQLDGAQHIIEELAGLRQTAIAPPDWKRRERGGKGRSVIVAHTSDVHMGEVVVPDEIDGKNEYNPDICRERMRRYFEAVCTVGPRWVHDDTCDGLLLTMGGDLISGDIHEELLRTNSMTSNEQLAAVIEVYEAGLRMTLETYPHVHVVAVPGNHGRTTVKPSAKLYGALSYDTLAATWLRDRFRDEPRVSWNIAAGSDAWVALYGRTILVTHGDKMGTGGGMGFAGPGLPILRGGNKLRLQAMASGHGIDLILSGHYHYSFGGSGHLGNGSVIGYSEYANAIRAVPDAPRQWVARLTMDRWIAETRAISLDDPPDEKPRIRVPVGFGNS